MLAAELQRRPTLTLVKLQTELAIRYKRAGIPQPKEWYAPVDSDTLTTYSPVTICSTIDGVDKKFKSSVLVDVFPPGNCLGPQELKCFNISRQEPTSEEHIDERASLVVFLVVPNEVPIPLKGLVNTRSGLSIPSFSSFNHIAVQIGAMLKPYQIVLYAVDGKTIKTFGMADRVGFQPGGDELVTNFVVVDDAMGVEDFLLGRNFLTGYQVLVDLTSMRIVVRAPVQPVWHHAHAQVGDPNLAVVFDQDLVLQPFDPTVVKANVVTTDLEPLNFHLVVLNASNADASLQNVVFS